MRSRQQSVLVVMAVWGSLGGCNCLQPGIGDSSSSSSSGTGGTQSSSALIANSSAAPASSASPGSSAAPASSAQPVSSSAEAPSSSLAAPSSSMMMASAVFESPGTRPAIAVGDDGTALLAWIKPGAVTGRSVHGAHYSAQAGWEQSAMGLGAELEDLRAPSVALADTQGVVVFGEESSNYTVNLARWLDGSGFTSSSVIAGGPSASVFAGRVAIDHTGGTALVPLLELSGMSPPRSITEVTSAGMVTPHALGASAQMESGRNVPVVSMADSGRAVAAWEIDETGSGTTVSVVTRDAAGTWSAPESISDAQTTRFAVAINDAGDALLVYTSMTGELRARFKPVGSTTWGAAETIGLTDIKPWAALSDSGVGLVVGDRVTSTSMPSGNGREYLFATRSAAGTWTAPAALYTDDPRDDTTPQAAFDARPDGRAVLALSIAAPDDTRQLAIIRFDPVTGWSQPESVGPAAEGGVYSPSVSWRANSIAVAWEDNDASFNSTVRAMVIP